MTTMETRLLFAGSNKYSSWGWSPFRCRCWKKGRGWKILCPVFIIEEKKREEPAFKWNILCYEEIKFYFQILIKYWGCSHDSVLVSTEWNWLSLLGQLFFDIGINTEIALGYKESISNSVTLQVREVEYQNIIYRVHALHCASDKAFAWEKNNHKEKQSNWKQCFWNHSGKKKFYHRKFSMVMFPSKSRQSYQLLLQHFRKCRFPLWKQKCPDSF